MLTIFKEERIQYKRTAEQIEVIARQKHERIMEIYEEAIASEIGIAYVLAQYGIKDSKPGIEMSDIEISTIDRRSVIFSELDNAKIALLEAIADKYLNDKWRYSVVGTLGGGVKLYIEQYLR